MGRAQVEAREQSGPQVLRLPSSNQYVHAQKVRSATIGELRGSLPFPPNGLFERVSPAFAESEDPGPRTLVADGRSLLANDCTRTGASHNARDLLTEGCSTRLPLERCAYFAVIGKEIWCIQQKTHVPGAVSRHIGWAWCRKGPLQGRIMAGD